MLQEEVLLEISARDGGTSPRFTTAELLVRLQDENDCTPQWLERASGPLQLTENNKPGARLALLQATDTDRGINGTVEYGLSPDTKVTQVHRK